MDRDPSIHITKSQFIRIWKSLTGKPLSPDFLDKLFTQARLNSADNRVLNISTKKEGEKAISRTQSSTEDANLLANIVYSFRIKLKHVGVSKIKQNEPQWLHIKDLVPIVNDFCDTYKLTKKSGYQEFISTGFTLFSKTNKPNYQYCVSWFSKNSQAIINYYNNTLKLNQDTNPIGTQEIYNLYTNKVLSMVGISNNYKSQPDKYIYFLLAREMADNIGIDYEDFIDAQFEALEFCNGIPNIEDLSNDKANQRLVRYLSKHNININVHKPKDISWDDFKK